MLCSARERKESELPWSFRSFPFFAFFSAAKRWQFDKITFGWRNVSGIAKNFESFCGSIAILLLVMFELLKFAQLYLYEQ